MQAAAKAILGRVFQIIPAVDIQRGKAVRLYEGDPDRETVYFENPAEAATHWVNLGAPLLHLVDLDAALGSGNNAEVVKRIASTGPARIQLGGGIRSLDSALTWLETVDTVILGTAAQRNPTLVAQLVERVGSDRVAVSIDARGDRVAVRGWVETSDTAVTDLARKLEELGLRYLIYTDVTRDGTMEGVDPDPVRRLRDVFPHRLVAGGGVGSDADLELYEEIGLQGAIVGRALYEGRVEYPRTA